MREQKHVRKGNSKARDVTPRVLKEIKKGKKYDFEPGSVRYKEANVKIVLTYVGDEGSINRWVLPNLL